MPSDRERWTTTKKYTHFRRHFVESAKMVWCLFYLLHLNIADLHEYKKDHFIHLTLFLWLCRSLSRSLSKNSCACVCVKMKKCKRWATRTGMFKTQRSDLSAVSFTLCLTIPLIWMQMKEMWNHHTFDGIYKTTKRNNNNNNTNLKTLLDFLCITLSIHE